MLDGENQGILLNFKGDEYKSGFVAITGKPNVGKSSLLNFYLKEKLSITTPKPQTTRNRITGILTKENFQIIFLDSPGIISPKDSLQASMVTTTKRILEESDVIILMVDASNYNSDLDDVVIKLMEGLDKPIILVINKIDLIKKSLLLPMIDDFRKRINFAEIIPISVLLKEGMEELLKLILKYLHVGMPFYPEDYLSDLPIRFFVSEIIREKIFKRLMHELPYSSAVKVEEFSKKTNKLYIKVNIFVEKPSQKGIVIGKGGSMLKRIGQESREDIEQFLGEPVYLELWVKVLKDWSSNTDKVKELGYNQ